MSMVHSAQERVIPTCAVVLLAALLLTGCKMGDPYEGWAVEPAGYWGNTQLVKERETGCLYAINTEAKDLAEPVAWRRPDGSHMGCRTTTANSVGMSEANAPTPPVKTGEG